MDGSDIERNRELQEAPARSRGHAGTRQLAELACQFAIFGAGALQRERVLIGHAPVMAWDGCISVEFEGVNRDFRAGLSSVRNRSESRRTLTALRLSSRTSALIAFPCGYGELPLLKALNGAILPSHCQNPENVGESRGPLVNVGQHS